MITGEELERFGIINLSHIEKVSYQLSWNYRSHLLDILKLACSKFSRTKGCLETDPLLLDLFLQAYQYIYIYIYIYMCVCVCMYVYVYN